MMERSLSAAPGIARTTRSIPSAKSADDDLKDIMRKVKAADAAKLKLTFDDAGHLLATEIAPFDPCNSSD
jgi:hypothetical protein